MRQPVYACLLYTSSEKCSGAGLPAENLRFLGNPISFYLKIRSIRYALCPLRRAQPILECQMQADQGDLLFLKGFRRAVGPGDGHRPRLIIREDAGELFPTAALSGPVELHIHLLAHTLGKVLRLFQGCLLYTSRPAGHG